MSDFGITTALQYSGGRDSRALLHLHRDRLNEIIVVWMNPGDAYPETVKEMHRLAATIPHFLILQGEVSDNIRNYGYPSDVVPIAHTVVGAAFMGSATPLIQSAFDCCNRSMWQPLQRAMKLLSITTVIRGQRRDEQYKNSLITDGAVIDGVKYVLPLESWSVPQVEQYLRDNHIKIPEYYKTEGTSHDCMHCTAYLGSYERRIANLPAANREEVRYRLAQIGIAVEQQLQPLKNILGN